MKLVCRSVLLALLQWFAGCSRASDSPTCCAPAWMPCDSRTPTIVFLAYIGPTYKIRIGLSIVLDICVSTLAILDVSRSEFDNMDEEWTLWLSQYHLILRILSPLIPGSKHCNSSLICLWVFRLSMTPLEIISGAPKKRAFYCCHSCTPVTFPMLKETAHVHIFTHVHHRSLASFITLGQPWLRTLSWAPTGWKRSTGV